MPPNAIAVAQRLAARFADQPGALLPLLHALQEELGCIPPETVGVLAEALSLSRAEVHGVITFYPHFRTEPAGRHVLQICRAEACQAMGGDALAAHAQARLGCDFHARSADGAFTLEPAYCLGLCAQSPALMLDGRPHARMTPARLDRLIDQGGQA
ncbi:formate dehydrogenase subunit gamma [Bordetella avium]|uniref:formate dehydrogenase subunit gamma n=1 Tax=Bordetella avium TaxID=521 RepID=UPI000E68384A|nr:formate dehydrogenase subunit gamma [Bordetella avium]RIQ66478.1 formate dehydrogenase subunit gamma [Bordetella avium]